MPFRNILAASILAAIAALPAAAQQAPLAPGTAQSPGYLGVLAIDAGNEAGAMLAEVMSEAPSAVAGLRSGDVVIAVDGQPVHSAREMIAALAQFGPGQSVTVTVQNDSFTRDVVVTLGERPAPPSRRFADFGRVMNAPPAVAWASIPRPDTLLEDRTPPEHRLGLHVQPANQAALSRRGLPNRPGVLVSRVERDSPADLAGLTIGCLIVGIDGAQITSRQALSKGLAAAGDSVELSFLVGSEERTTTLLRHDE